MAVTARRRLETTTTRRFGSGREAVCHSGSHRDPDEELRAVPSIRSAARQAQGRRAGRRAAGNLPDRELRQEALALVPALRAGQAALRAGRMPPAAPDLRPAVPRLAAAEQRAAGRGRSLPRRHADHARRRRVHHQRRRARRGEPAAPQPGVDFVSEMEAGERRLLSCRIIPERGSWIEINTTKKDSSPSASTRAASSRR